MQNRADQRIPGQRRETGRPSNPIASLRGRQAFRRRRASRAQGGHCRDFVESALVGFKGFAIEGAGHAGSVRVLKRGFSRLARKVSRQQRR